MEGGIKEKGKEMFVLVIEVSQIQGCLLGETASTIMRLYCRDQS